MRWLGLHLAGISLALVACTGPSVSGHHLGTSETLATTADTRLVYTRPAGPWNEGILTPGQVICAEPSPDVAKAIATALSAAIEAEAKGAMGKVADPSVSASVSRMRTESIAQLGRRLGTIQLLRGGLFSACEAYANGALTRNSYTHLLSRFGDVMVTMLAIELVASDAPEPVMVTAPPAQADAATDKGEAHAQPTGTQAGSTGKKPGASTTLLVAPKPAEAGASGAHPALSDRQVAAIEAMQQRFLEGSDAGPMVMTCSGALEHGKIPASLQKICEDFLREYGEAKVDMLQARAAQTRGKVQVTLPSNSPAAPPRATQTRR